MSPLCIRKGTISCIIAGQKVTVGAFVLAYSAYSLRLGAMTALSCTAVCGHMCVVALMAAAWLPCGRSLACSRRDYEGQVGR